MSLWDWLAPTLVIYGLGMVFLVVTSLTAYADAKNTTEARYYARWFWIGLTWPIACLVWLARKIGLLWVDAWGKDA